MHYGWIIVAACLVIGISGYGTYFSFTLFYPYLVDEFAWSRTAISGAMSVGLIGYGVFALPMGWCADRFGPRRTIAAGGVIFGCGTALGSGASEVWHLYALYGGLTAIGMGAAWAPLVSTISRWFEDRRGLAIGIGSLGGGTGIFFVAPLATALLQTVGWREAYLWLGLVSGCLIAGAALLLRGDPAASGLSPYGAGRTAAQDSGARSGSGQPHRAGGDGMAEILRTWLFWRMVLTFGLWWFGGAIVYVQLAPFVLEKGFAFHIAGYAVVAFGAGNGVGKIVMGMISDRLGGRQAYQISLIVASVSMLALAWSDGLTATLALTALFGFAFGGSSPQLTTISVALFGLRSIGALMGAVLAIVGIIGAGGPLVSGMIFDATRSYELAYCAGAGILFASLLLATSLRR